MERVGREEVLDRQRLRVLARRGREGRRPPGRRGRGSCSVGRATFSAFCQSGACDVRGVGLEAVVQHQQFVWVVGFQQTGEQRIFHRGVGRQEGEPMRAEARAILLFLGLVPELA